jgi:hypothetical protein
MQWIYSKWLTPPDCDEPGPFYPWPEDWLRGRPEHVCNLWRFHCIYRQRWSSSGGCFK